MANKTKQVFIRVPVMYAKVLGAPVPTYDKTAKEWTIEAVLDKETSKVFKDLGVGDRIKTKEKFLDGTPHFHFKRPERRKDGEFNKPIPIVDAAGNAWDQEKLIGNGSVCDIKFNFVDFGTGKFPGVYIQGIRVLKHIPYEATGFEPLSEDDEFFAEAQEVEAEQTDSAPPSGDADDLDDDVPY